MHSFCTSACVFCLLLPFLPRACPMLWDQEGRGRYERPSPLSTLDSKDTCTLLLSIPRPHPLSCPSPRLPRAPGFLGKHIWTEVALLASGQGARRHRMPGTCSLLRKPWNLSQPLVLLQTSPDI